MTETKYKKEEKIETDDMGNLKKHEIKEENKSE
jgi:hypothetical protein